MSILSIKSISKFYALDGKHQEQALRNINLQIAKGKITAIYGPSGCGKTSLLNIISGLDRQYEGDLEFKGESLRDLSEIELTHKCSPIYTFYFSCTYVLHAKKIRDSKYSKLFLIQGFHNIRNAYRSRTS